MRHFCFNRRQATEAQQVLAVRDFGQQASDVKNVLCIVPKVTDLHM
jgi:hypothetical protein